MMKRKIIMSLCGIFLCAVSVGVVKTGALGVDPFQVFMSGMDKLCGIGFGTIFLIVNSFFLVFSLIFDKRFIGIGTVLNLVVLGYVAQFTMELLLSVIPEPSMVLRFAFLIVGTVGLCFSAALYMTSDLGVSTYDAIAMILAYTWKVGEFKYLRITTDIISIVLGTALFLIGGGTLQEVPTVMGIGTILSAVCMGPLIDFFRRKVSEPMLNRGTNKHFNGL